MRRPFFMLPCLLSIAAPVAAEDMTAQVRSRADQVEAKVIAWRRDIHEHPELANREFRTSSLVARHLQALKFDEVRTQVAHTGVIGVLKGGKPGPVIALRADMDALPVTERTGLPFASTVKAIRGDREVGVMHACGHDAHTAILMGAAEVLASMRSEIAGTILFLFQPAEEGAPDGEEGGARLVLKEGALSGAYRPEAIFGQHVWPGEAGTVSYRARGQMAAADRLSITVTGAQSHGSQPWHGVDPVVTSAQIMLALQLIPSRQLDASKAPSVITIGQIEGGTASNIMPESVEMVGTIRTFDSEMREDLIARVRRTAESIAASAGAKAEVTVDPYAPVVYNDPDLVKRMEPTLRKASGGHLREMALVMGSEDFSHYMKDIPGLFVFLGVNMPEAERKGTVPDVHTPTFMLNEAALKQGVVTMSMLALDYLQTAQPLPPGGERSQVETSQR
ncbi:amidohydrolase [Croceicoccus bisphenolivorans]|uniref:amidohydrolase n=1 Tax=Croceicoccus bisphenolivorans TaxID=1783232 RepID=UPI00083113D3|nr:amidohydrolase [Croceicoccus bisphenolivorans]